MGHLDEGTLRRSIDEPASTPSQAGRHLAACASCRARRDAMERDARLVAATLAVRDQRPADMSSSYSRLVGALESGSPQQRAPSLSERMQDLYRWRARPFALPLAAGSLAAAAILLLLFTPVGTLAQSFLTIFEPRQFVAIPVTKGEFAYLPDLENFGTIVAHSTPQDREVAGPAQATALTGIRVRLPGWLPASVPRQVHFAVSPRGWGTFVFSAAKARAYAAAAHRQMPAMPSRLDGSRLTLQVGPMAIVGYGTVPSRPRPFDRRRSGKGEEGDGEMHLPPLVIVEAVAPSVTSTGASARDIESYLLQMPGVAPQLADEIRAIGDPSTTMPIPVPVDKAFSQNVSVDGVWGLAVGDDTGVGGMIVWQKNGIVYGVGGAMRQQDLMEVARSLR